MMGRQIKIGINGFGRIGRTLFRVNMLSKLFDIVAINDICGDVGNLAYQLKYDSSHGVLSDHEIGVAQNGLLVDGHKIDVFTKENICDVPWKDLHVDIVVGCTGLTKNVESAKKCLRDSVKKVVFSDSPENVDFTFVMGVNQERYLPDKHNIIAGSICDVVGVAPLIKHIESSYGIQSGFLLTLHPWLAYQNVLDGTPNPSVIKDPTGTSYAIGRASVMSLIPKNTSLVGALERAMPEMKGKFKAMSYRVPTNMVASLYAILILDENITRKEAIEYSRSINDEPYLEYTEEPMVSVDYRHYRSSCVVDGKWIEVVSPNILRMVTWYDNEWGYTSRLADIIQYISNYF